MKFETLNSKFEIISKFKILNLKSFGFWILVFGVCLGFSAWCFGFVENALALEANPGAGEGVKYNLIQPLPGIQQVSTFPEYAKKIIPIILGLAAVLAVVKIVWAGIRYATSLGNVKTMEDARDDIWQAILGLALAIGSYLILNTINPDLVNLHFFPSTIEIAPPAINTCTKTCPEGQACALTPSGAEACVPKTQSNGYAKTCQTVNDCPSGLQCLATAVVNIKQCRLDTIDNGSIYGGPSACQRNCPSPWGSCKEISANQFQCVLQTSSTGGSSGGTGGGGASGGTTNPCDLIKAECGERTCVIDELGTPKCGQAF